MQSNENTEGCLTVEDHGKEKNSTSFTEGREQTHCANYSVS